MRFHALLLAALVGLMPVAAFADTALTVGTTHRSYWDTARARHPVASLGFRG